MSFFKTGFILLLLFCSIQMLALDKKEREVINAIRTGDFDFVDSFIKNRSDVDCEFSNGRSGLYYAIKFDRSKIAELMLRKGANPENESAKLPILNWAIKYDRRKIASLLIEYGANVERTDSKLNTPLILAAKSNNLWMCKVLIDRGANPMHLNSMEKKASDYSAYWEKQNTHEYLLSIEKLWLMSSAIPSKRDGPYIYHEADDELVMQYYEHIQSENKTRLIEKTIIYSGNDTIINGFGWDQNSYHIKENYKPISYKIESDADVFAVGDVHGEYDVLFNLLRNNKIIDEDGKWIFGNGQLIFLGDLFDRGSMVTETLWFLHELSFEAEEFGGKLIVLLGNHEIMVMKGDYRYVNSKYNYFNQYTFTKYSELFGKNTVLGKWLRNQGVIQQINDNLFLHAGISPQFNVKNYSYPEINLAIQLYLNSEEDLKKGSDEDIILSSYGPLWYRGYAASKSEMPQVPQQFVDNYLSSRGLSHMVLGHNEQKNITTSYEGKVISIDIHFNEDGSSAQGLLISDHKLYRCYSNGIKEEIK